MYVSAIIVAAGCGKRFGAREDKLFCKIKKVPLLAYPLTVLERHPLVREIIVVASLLNISRIRALIKRYKIHKVRSVVIGGRRRQDSVYNGIDATSKSAVFVLIHDGARPFIEAENISRVIKEAAKYKAAVLAVPVIATVKRAVAGTLKVKETIDRKDLWQIQTPQVFKKELLLEGYKKFGRYDVTDEAVLIEKMRRPVRLVAGSYENIKITTVEDLLIADAIAGRSLCP